MERKKQKTLGLMANICLVMIFLGKALWGAEWKGLLEFS